MGRKRAFPWRWRILAGLLLAGLGLGAWQWWEFLHWAPERDKFPVQGARIDAGDGDVSFTALAAIGANFVYLDASQGSKSRDPAFPRNLARTRASGLRFGVIHQYDPCETADRQSANFVTIVARDEDSLPPAIALDKLADDCPENISDAEVESELTTFLNQVESHVGKPALLKVSPGFETRYSIAARMDRNLWLEGDRLQPDYAGRPWMLWTANSALHTQASDNPLRWVVAQP